MKRTRESGDVDELPAPLTKVARYDDEEGSGGLSGPFAVPDLAHKEIACRLDTCSYYALSLACRELRALLISTRRPPTTTLNYVITQAAKEGYVGPFVEFAAACTSLQDVPMRLHWFEVLLARAIASSTTLAFAVVSATRSCRWYTWPCDEDLTSLLVKEVLKDCASVPQFDERRRWVRQLMLDAGCTRPLASIPMLLRIVKDPELKCDSLAVFNALVDDAAIESPDELREVVHRAATRIINWKSLPNCLNLLRRFARLYTAAPRIGRLQMFRSVLALLAQGDLEHKQLYLDAWSIIDRHPPDSTTFYEDVGAMPCPAPDRPPLWEWGSFFGPQFRCWRPGARTNIIDDMLMDKTPADDVWFTPRAISDLPGMIRLAHPTVLAWLVRRFSHYNWGARAIMTRGVGRASWKAILDGGGVVDGHVHDLVPAETLLSFFQVVNLDDAMLASLEIPCLTASSLHVPDSLPPPFADEERAMVVAATLPGVKILQEFIRVVPMYGFAKHRQAISCVLVQRLHDEFPTRSSFMTST
jgi:hypothetical protein